MRFPASTLLCASLLSPLALVPSVRAIAVHEQLPGAPDGWNLVGAPSGDAQIRLHVGLTLENLDVLEKRLYEVSDPTSKDYGNHLEGDDVDAIIKPSKAAEQTVLAWLARSGVEKVHSDGQWVTFVTTVKKADALLGTSFAEYEKDGVKKIRTTSYSLPDDLVSAVDLVHPTTYFGHPTAHAPPAVHYGMAASAALAPRADPDASCANLITPECLKQIYNVGDYQADPKAGSQLAFGSFLNQSAVRKDLQAFEKAQGIPSQGFQNVLINGGKDDQANDGNHGEANLDVEYQVGIAHPLPVTQYITGGSPPFVPNIDEPVENQNEPYLDYYNYLLAQPNAKLPQVISNSYGDVEETVPQKYAERVCNQIMQLGVRGITVIESSGDTGVGAGCKSNDGKNRTVFEPQFPATCPYVLAVGGTESISPEIAWTGSSGGFSNYFPQPAYQKDAVSTYLDEHLPAATRKRFGKYANFAGRGFPDVAAHSLRPDYSVVVNGETTVSGGTSAAAPVVAGIFALLNDARLRAGKKALGFVNPLIYAGGYKALTDITDGASVGCNGVNGQTGDPVEGGGIVPGAAWNATQGWDPATGFGVPDFQKLKAFALAAP